MRAIDLIFADLRRLRFAISLAGFAIAACSAEPAKTTAKSPAAETNKAPAKPAPSTTKPRPGPGTAQLPPTRVATAERIVAIGDVHGDLAATKQALQIAGLIGPDDHWTGGKTVLVQTGDQLDRGNDEREIIALLEALQTEAEAAGGKVYILNGNHELMNAAGDLRYVTPEGFTDFAGVPNIDLHDARLQKVPEPMRPRLAAFLPGGPYGQKLATRPVVLMVGKNIFVHGGILPEHVSYGLEKINSDVYNWLSGKTDPPMAIIAGDSSPVWTRDYSNNPDGEDCETLYKALTAAGADRMVVGHTVQETGITSACNGKVWMIDVGMAKHYGGQAAALEIRGDQVTVLKP